MVTLKMIGKFYTFDYIVLIFLFMLLLFADSLIYKDFLKPIIEVATLIFLAYTYLSQRKIIKIQNETISIQKKEINDKTLKESENLLKTKLAIKGIIDELLLPTLKEVESDYIKSKKIVETAAIRSFPFTLLTPLEIKISNVFDKIEIVDAFKGCNSISLPKLLDAENHVDFVLQNPPLDFYKSFTDKMQKIKPPEIQEKALIIQSNYSQNIANRIADIEYAIAVFKKTSEELK